MRSVLVWKDGSKTEQPDDSLVCMWIYSIDIVNGKYIETAFGDAIHNEEEDCVYYFERAARDVTEDMRRVAQESDERTWKYLRKGWDA